MQITTLSEYAQQFPERVKDLTLICPTCGPSGCLANPNAMREQDGFRYADCPLRERGDRLTCERLILELTERGHRVQLSGDHLRVSQPRLLSYRLRGEVMLHKAALIRMLNDTASNAFYVELATRIFEAPEADTTSRQATMDLEQRHG